MEKQSTREILMQIGKTEFLDKGYKDASLREITKKAGYTLGAFYGYFSSKEMLFEEIVGAAADGLYNCFCDKQYEFADLPEAQQVSDLFEASGAGMEQMVQIIYDNFDVFRLVFFCSAGTKYEGYLQKFIDLEIVSSRQFISALNRQGHCVELDDELIQIVASALFTGISEVVRHNMKEEKAKQYMAQLRTFYSAGWQRLLGL